MFLGFAVGWIVGWPIIIGSCVVIGYFMLKEEKTRSLEFKNRCDELGVIYKPHLSDEAREFYIGVSEEKGTVLMQFRISTNHVEEIFFALREVLNVELSLDDNSIYKAGPLAALTSAAIGGVAFGGAGAIVGLLTTSHVRRGKIGNLILKLRMNNIDTPLIQVAFIVKPAKSSSSDTIARLELAEKWTNLIEVLRYRIAESQLANQKA